ncbi:MAG TPA: endonuclease/exonuclease/phosphatase family protein [Gemmatimonadaceae bacterium]|nr:endonuclease/exonuclease/phosphatase family protein [Gemmatimonadaceae bacterium]
MPTTPTTFRVECTCGERFHADERSLGRRLRCRRCGRAVDVRRPGREWKPGATWDLARRRERERDTERARGGSATATTGRRRRRSVRSRLRRLLRSPFRGATRREAAATGVGRVVSTLSWAYLAGACVAALLIWGFGDAWWPATVLLFSGRWVALLPLALLVPAALLLARRSLAPLLAAMLIVLFPVMGFRTGWRRALPAPTAAGTHLRVVTLNADGGDWIVAQLPFLLRAWSPDVVALQECGAELAASARALAAGGGGWYEHDVGGLCLLARHSIRGAAVMDREALERVRQARSGIGGAGYVVRYVLDTPAGAVTLTNLHLETPRKGFEGLTGADGVDSWRLRENTVLRDIESDLARRWAVGGGTVGTGAPLLVVGDFNTPVESRIFRRHWGDLADAFSVAGVGLGMTKYNGWIRARIDHVLAGDGWHVDRAAVGDDVGSDHRPLVVDLTLEKRR